MTAPRVSIVTLGCKVNAYDSATIADRLRGAGCRIVAPAAPAEVVIINSCTVTDAADAEARRLAHRARRSNPRARIIVTGCWAQAKPAEVAGMDAVDHVIGLGRLERLVDTVLAVEPSRRVDVTPGRDLGRVPAFGARTFPGQTRAFLKVQEGCDLFCTFCIVPMARGRSRSLAPRTVLEELRALAERGFEEVVLTGVHLGGYGHDLRPATNLAELVAALAEQRLVPRLRLSSVDPHEVSPELLDAMRTGEGICPHLHVPLQAGDDGVLRRMRRRYGAALAMERLCMIRNALPDAQIGTDVLAGFPGEDDDAFERTATFLASSPVTYGHVFPYSARSGTTAAKMDAGVPLQVRRARAERLREICAARQAVFLSSFDGTEAEVLVERTRERASGRLRGYTRNYTRVRFEGPDALRGRRVAVRLTVRDGAQVTGRVLA